MGTRARDPGTGAEQDRGLVLVTGASRGIGRATALLASRCGYSVALTYASREEAARQVVARIEQGGGQGFALQADIADEAAVQRVFAALDAAGTPLVALVNNAAVLDRQTRLDAMSRPRMQRIFMVNVLGTFLCTREAVRRLSTRHGGAGGSIVNVSSMAARLGSPDEYIDYAASKGAIDTLTVGLAREVADEGIRVNCVRPGLIHTEMHASAGEPGRVERLEPTVPMRRGGRPEEVAQAIVWLLGPEASYVTGAFIDVAGGR